MNECIFEFSNFERRSAQQAGSAPTTRALGTKIVFVTRMLTRDLFAVADLLVVYTLGQTRNKAVCHG